MSLAFLAQRWSCSRQTCRRVLEAGGVRALYLGGGARNATLRFDFEEVLELEARAKGSQAAVHERAEELICRFRRTAKKGE
ncbi:MAG: hypothetical protein R3F30_06415 [Planctomycetota bacterium]